MNIDNSEKNTPIPSTNIFNTNFDIMIAPSVATEMTVEYMVFS